MEARLPTGTLTFLFTDVEGSTRTLTELGVERYAEELEAHNRLIRAAVAAHGGVEVDTQGDAFFCVFTSARGAVACAQDAQRALAATRIRVRMGVHSGEAIVLDGHYVGLDVHRAARVAGAAHGGQVLLSPTTVPLLEPGSFELLDLGEHRLKDLSAPLRLYQLGTGAFPALKTLHRTNLPLPATPFLGRQREVDALKSRTERLLTLTGPGGTGKTRLALQVAAGRAEEFPGGVFWVPLAPLREDAVVPTAIAAVFDADDVETAADSLADDTLLVVDNCEHVLDEAARAVGTLLRRTEKLRVVATSREPLALAGEHVVPVEPLEHDDAVELFVARAEAAGAAALDAEAVAELCRRLDDLPLAIELAAARTPALPPDLLLERLAGRLDLLRGARDADDRQRTLAATIGWSYDLLSDEEKRTFRNLSLFRGGAGLAAVEEVAEAELDDLASVVAKSLVRVLSTPHGPRYWMLETIRDFAAAQLADEGAAPVEGRFVRFFAALSARAAPELGDREAVAWLERLEADAGNLRLAFSLAAETSPADAAVIGATLANLHIVRGRYGEAAEVLETALERADDLLLTARLNRLSGELAVRHDEFDAAGEAYAAGLLALGAPAVGDEAWWREWLDLKLRETTLHYWKADSARLHDAAAVLRPHVERHGTPRQQANFIETQVYDLLRRNRYVASAEAEELARAYVDAAEAAGDWDGHFMLGFVLLWRSKFEEAADQLQSARDVARTVGDVLTEMRGLVYGAIARRRLGDADAVRDLDGEIAQFDETYGYTGLIAANRAWLALRDRDLDATERHGAAALADWPHEKRAGPTVFQWTARFPLLAVDVERQRRDGALAHARAMLEESQHPLAPAVRASLESGSMADAVRLARAHGYT